eukprot:jgi/Picre1/29274/NNA_004666.t1
MGTSPRRGALAQRAKKKKATQQTVRYANETGMGKRKKPRYVPKRGKRQGSIENRVQEEEEGDTRFATEACIAKAVEHLIKSDPSSNHYLNSTVEIFLKHCFQNIFMSISFSREEHMLPATSH